MKSLGYVHTPITELHRWSPYSRRSISTGRGSFSRTTRLMLHQMRWRKPPRQYGLMVTAWTLSILVHLVAMVGMLLVRPPPAYQEPTPKGDENAIHLRIIEARPPPPPVAPQPRRVARTQPRSAPTRHARAPSRAPRQAPVPVLPPMRPVTELKLAKVRVNTAQKPIVPKLIEPAPAAKPPQPAAKPVAKPVPEVPAESVPPPKVVLEPSKMALPPPKIALQEPQPVSQPRSSTPELQPVPVERPRIEISVPRPEVPVEKAAPLAVLPVMTSPDTDTAPPIDVGTPTVTPEPMQAPARPKIQTQQPQDMALLPQTLSSPSPAASQAQPAAPLLAPDIHIEPGTLARVPKVDVTRPELTPAPDLLKVSTPASAPAPAHAASVTAPARVVSVARPAPPSSTSWAHASDTFSKLPVKQPGHGSADQSQAGKGSPQGVPDYIQRQPQGNSDVMTRHYKGLHYRRTIFDQYWAPANQDLLTSLLHRLVDALSFKKTFDLGHGVRVHCGGWLLGFGCGGDPPSGPSALSGDRRLNMAPAKPLVPGVGASVAKPLNLAPPVSSKQTVECETARVSGGPLPPGCKPARGAQGDW